MTRIAIKLFLHDEFEAVLRVEKKWQLPSSYVIKLRLYMLVLWYEIRIFDTFWIFQCLLSQCKLTTRINHFLVREATITENQMRIRKLWILLNQKELLKKLSLTSYFHQISRPENLYHAQKSTPQCFKRTFIAKNSWFPCSERELHFYCC